MTMVESQNLAPQILAELASMPEACPLVEDLADLLMVSAEDAWDDLLQVQAGGWVDLWPDDPRGPSVTLSPLSASRLGLALSADGSRWVCGGDRDIWREACASGLTEADCTANDDFRGSLFSALPDLQALEGLDSLIIAERIATEAASHQASCQDEARSDESARTDNPWTGFQSARDAATLPRPSLLLGLGPAWPVRWNPDRDPCPGCGSRSLSITAVCLVCLRSGLDSFLPEVLELPPDPPEEVIPKRSRRPRRRRTEPSSRVALVSGGAA